ncbi:hypothetical protein GOP47_0020332 [Adiantum capillus-veneris]|uniref:Uncharacterized protein n=1 Tax=Adiantum capillus-veneris TaxID=13818 RepID=A0A9D4UDF8_ADICA|nr:hypothetical protein GOP47_0020332 [Adiantum capillus-veneris]
MTMADVLRAACTLHDPSSNPTEKVGAQMIGFLSILAISGSVALLSLAAKSKLLRQEKVYLMPEEEEEGEAYDGSDDDDDDYEVHNDEEEEEEEEEEMPQECTCNHPQFEATVQAPSKPKTNLTPPKPKRVTFAPDVVDPSCHGHIYRSKWKVSIPCHHNSQESTLSASSSTPPSSVGPCHQPHRPTPSLTPKAPSTPANRLALYKGLRQSKLRSLHHW